MKVKLGSGATIVSMTLEELGIIRYALSVGVEKLEGTASFMKAMKSEEEESAARTARIAKDASEALEAAIQSCLRG